MKIIELNAENIKRLSAVEIHPDENLQIIGGNNGHGKSSVLDAIWLALGGGTAKKGTVRPIRDGADKAKVTLDLGDLKVTRTWTSNDKSVLKVESVNGAQFKSPQAMLDKLVGKFSFDPLAFTQLSAKEQRQQLMGLVDLSVDVDALDSERAEVFAKRTEVGRKGKEYGTVTVDETLPETEGSMTDLLDRISNAERTRDENALTLRKKERTQDRITELTNQIEELQNELVSQKNELHLLEDIPLVEHEDIDALKTSIRTLEETNVQIRVNNQARIDKQAQDELRAEYEKLTSKLAEIDKVKADALAKAVFPVAGLGFDTDGVTYNGIPFSQASSAEQIRVSLAMAMAMNPELRVIRIMDGSLLDEDNLALIREMATANDFQVWIERVGKADEGAVIIEEGKVEA